MFDRSTMPAILPDLIPGSSWGSSLFNLLTKQSWDGVRLPVIRRQGRACQICGSQAGAMECHEIWAYSMPPKHVADNTFGVQRLIGLASLCKPHHEMFHMGRALAVNNYDAVKARLKAVNRWSEQEFAAYYSEHGDQWTARSKALWALDVSLVGGGAPLVIKPGWAMDEDGCLTRPNPYGGKNITMILGAAYQIDGKLMPSVDPAMAYDGLMGEEGDFDFVRSMGNGVNAEVARPRAVVPPPISKRVEPIKEWSAPGVQIRVFDGDTASDYLEELRRDSAPPVIPTPAPPPPVWTSSVPPAPMPAPTPPESGIKRWWRNLWGAD